MALQRPGYVQARHPDDPVVVVVVIVVVVVGEEAEVPVLLLSEIQGDVPYGSEAADGAACWCGAGLVPVGGCCVFYWG